MFFIAKHLPDSAIFLFRSSLKRHIPNLPAPTEKRYKYSKQNSIDAARFDKQPHIGSFRSANAMVEYNLMFAHNHLDRLLRMTTVVTDIERERDIFV